MKIFKKIGSLILDIFETIVIALSVFVLMYLFLFQPHQVKGSSMYPSFHDGEYLLTDKVSYQFNAPDRGDVIIFKAPGREDYDYIKRIIGLPGETVKILNGEVLINDEELKEVYLPDDFTTRASGFAKEGQGVFIPENQFFVLGDNRNHSSDSRVWGLVPEDNIIGKSWLKYWPINEAGKIPKYEYGFSSVIN